MGDGALSYEDMLRLADILGQHKPPTASADEVEASGLSVVKGTAIGRLQEDGKVLPITAERCLGRTISSDICMIVADCLSRVQCVWKIMQTMKMFAFWLVSTASTRIVSTAGWSKEPTTVPPVVPLASRRLQMLPFLHRPSLLQFEPEVLHIALSGLSSFRLL